MNLSAITAIVINIIGLLIVFSAYGSVSNSFEKFVISLLVLIYISVSNFLTIYSRTTVSTALGLDFEIKRLRKLLKDKVSEEEEESAKRIQEKMESSNIAFMINSGFSLLIFIIVVFNLIFL